MRWATITVNWLAISTRKYICFRGGMIPGLSPSDTHVDFGMVNAPFHVGPDFIKGNLFIRIPLDSGKRTEAHVFASIGCAPLFSGAVGILANAYPPSFYNVDFWAYPFAAKFRY